MDVNLIANFELHAVRMVAQWNVCEADTATRIAIDHLVLIPRQV